MAEPPSQERLELAATLQRLADNVTAISNETIRKCAAALRAADGEIADLKHDIARHVEIAGQEAGARLKADEEIARLKEDNDIHKRCALVNAEAMEKAEAALAEMRRIIAEFVDHIPDDGEFVFDNNCATCIAAKSVLFHHKK